MRSEKGVVKCRRDRSECRPRRAQGINERTKLDLCSKLLVQSIREKEKVVKMRDVCARLRSGLGVEEAGKVSILVAKVAIADRVRLTAGVPGDCVELRAALIGR